MDGLIVYFFTSCRQKHVPQAFPVPWVNRSCHHLDEVARGQRASILRAERAPLFLFMILRWPRCR